MVLSVLIGNIPTVAQNLNNAMSEYNNFLARVTEKWFYFAFHVFSLTHCIEQCAAVVLCSVMLF